MKMDDGLWNTLARTDPQPVMLEGRDDTYEDMTPLYI